MKKCLIFSSLFLILIAAMAQKKKVVGAALSRSELLVKMTSGPVEGVCEKPGVYSLMEFLSLFRRILKDFEWTREEIIENMSI